MEWNAFLETIVWSFCFLLCFLFAFLLSWIVSLSLSVDFFFWDWGLFLACVTAHLSLHM